ncbi:hypothetical protein CC2G_009161 [Coprinopsis cinerea AmutBmut pab1-1]|nr:hypothetical protein CC2G_009161 [Coprinopsis cinerea AmutBmut pab1-1]
MSTKDALWDTGYDETVEVNQRALIDKVLARYSGEFTVFRELLQNSDDARSEAVEIHFDTDGSVPLETPEGELKDLKSILVQRWTFKNNGILFRDEDWNRLKKIAEGNPDEEKIGAFGVGFYSLFSVTDDPFVTSGDQWMAFYWKDKKDQLYARRGSLPEDKRSVWTTFEMPLREPATLPPPFDFIRFLCSSITFMSSLRKISVFLDDKCLATLEKTVGESKAIAVPYGLRTRTTNGTMTVTGVRSTALHIRADVMKWVYSAGSERKRPILSVPKISKPVTGFFSSIFSSFSGSSTPKPASTPLPPPVEEEPKKSDLLEINSTSISLSIFTADVNVRLDKKMTAELVRSTKKNPPSKMRYDLIYTGQADYEASIEEDKKYPSSTGSIFQGLRADLEGLGTTRVFIGHATAQTTGIGGHMAARFIPTVEREAIDFMDRNIAVWNKELLGVGGVLARTAYEHELSEIQSIWDKNQTPTSPPPSEIQESLTRRAVHALKFFTFHQSTPSPDVSQLLEEGFFTSLARFPIISSRGVRSSTEVRMRDESLAGFMKELPVLPDLVTTDSAQMITTLQSRSLLKPTVFNDILTELKARPLPKDEMVTFMKWWIKSVDSASAWQKSPETMASFQRQLIQAAVLRITGERPEDEKFVPLSSIRTFVGTKTILPTEGPLPEHVLPLQVSKEFNPDSLRSAFPWSELTVQDWLTHLCSLIGKAGSEQHDITLSPQWSERVLGVLARAWPSISATSKLAIHKVLATKACIPTNLGMKMPADTYFPNVNMFPDLPIVTFPSGNVVRGAVEKLLQDLGLRKHVELQVIFTRMVKTNQWTIPELIKYLVSVESTLTEEEKKMLRATKAFAKEGETGTDPEGRPFRYCARDLYEPSETFRKLKLPVLDWGQTVRWRSNSAEAKFLHKIGLQQHPSLETLIQLCASDDVEVRTTALRYLLDNISNKYQDYSSARFASVAYLPAIRGTESLLGTPKEVFASRIWGELGFTVLHPSFQSESIKLQVKEHPSSAQLYELFQKRPPSDEEEAAKMFSIVATRLNDLSNNHKALLSQMHFVPVKAQEKGQTIIRRLPPSQCYLKANTDAIHSKLFTFVNFGSAANAFLMACGARQEPNLDEIAKILLDDPRRFYQLCEGPEQYLSELRNMAVNVRMISDTTIARMKRNPILLAMQRKAKSSKKESKDLEEEEWDISYDLKKGDQIVVVDDTAAYQVFGEDLWTAPQEDILEGFYIHLGSHKLSSLVREEHRISKEIPNHKQAAAIRSLVLERLPLFLHEHTHTRPKVSLTWLAAPNNFIVRAFGTLSIIKTLRLGTLVREHRSEASAVARRESGSIQLWIAGNTAVDHYEVALAMNKLLFDAPKTNDALLFMTILSTDLGSLKRRGYNVDRILKQQRIAREAQLAAPPPPPPPPRTEEYPNEKQSLQSAPPPPPSKVPPPAPPPIPPKPGAVPPPAGSSDDKGSRAPIGGPPTMPGGGAFGAFQSLREKLGNIAGTSSSARRSESPAPRGNELTPPPPPAHSPSPSARSGIKPSATPQDRISANIDMAIRACRPESQSLVRNREHMEQVKESLNDSYCDASGHNQHLVSLGEIGNVKIFISQDVPPQISKSFLKDNYEALCRFIHILLPLSQIYNLPEQSLHIFYDMHGGLIAFNRNSSLFMNFRYFEAWHDAEVRAGQLNSAYISWYFTLAHEIAHNLVQPHNSEHEFYFSAICERHLISLANLLSK